MASACSLHLALLYSCPPLHLKGCQTQLCLPPACSPDLLQNGQGTAAGVAASIKGKIDSKAAQEERYRLMIKR